MRLEHRSTLKFGLFFYLLLRMVCTRDAAPLWETKKLRGEKAISVMLRGRMWIKQVFCNFSEQRAQSIWHMYVCMLHLSVVLPCSTMKWILDVVPSGEKWKSTVEKRKKLLCSHHCKITTNHLTLQRLGIRGEKSFHMYKGFEFVQKQHYTLVRMLELKPLAFQNCQLISDGTN